MRNRVIIVSDGYNTNLFVNGKVFGDYITYVKYEHSSGRADGTGRPELKVTAETLPMEGEEDVEEFRRIINSVLAGGR